MLTKLLRPFHLKLFYSGKHIHASIISKIENKCIISTSSNNRLYRETLGEYAPKNDQTASEAVAKVLLEKLKNKQVGRADQPHAGSMNDPVSVVYPCLKPQTDTVHAAFACRWHRCSGMGSWSSRLQGRSSSRGLTTSGTLWKR